MSRRGAGGLLFIVGVLAWAFGLSLVQNNSTFLVAYMLGSLGLGSVLAILMGLWLLLVRKDT
jgi:hypothetical protein